MMELSKRKARWVRVREFDLSFRRFQVPAKGATAMGPEGVAVLVPLGFFAMVAVIVIGRPMVKAIAAKTEAEAKRPALPQEVAARLERMEQSIDAIAVEIERISEGQRFTTKLLAEVRDTPALGVPARPKDSTTL